MNRFSRLIRQQIRQHGFSIVELMVGLTISLVLVTIASAVYVSTRRMSRTTDEMAYLQEQGRFVLNLIGKDIRVAGFTHGGLDSKEITLLRDGPNPAIIGCTGGFADIPSGIVNFPNPTPVTCATAPSSNAPDALFVQFESGNPDTSVSPARYLADTSTANGVNCLGNTPMYVIYTVGQPPTIQPKTASSSTPPPPGSVALVQNFYYLSKRTQTVDGVLQTTGQLNCAGVGEAGVIDTQPLVQGVQDMRISYALDSDGDQIIDTPYMTASAVPVTDWKKVLSVRVCVLMQTQAANVSLTQQKYVDCNGVTQTPAAHDRFVRKAFTATFNLRNRVSL